MPSPSLHWPPHEKPRAHSPGFIFAIWHGCRVPAYGGISGVAVKRGTLTGTTLNAAVAGNVTSANAYDGLNNIPNNGYFYPTGGLATSTTIGTMATTYTGSVPSVTYAITGDTNSCYKMSGANLQVNSSTGSCAAGSASETITITTSASGFTGTPAVTTTSYLTQTYYLNTAGGGGSDSNNGLTSGAPWLSLNHSVHCGDVISMAASTSYSASTLGSSGTSGTTTCPGNDNLAYLKCASTLTACKVSGGTNGIWITSNYWGLIGVDVKRQGNSCIKTSPVYPPGTGATVHHFAVVNSIVAGCAGSGIKTGPAAGSGNGNDYEIILGVISYNNTSANGPCFSGVSMAGDTTFDTNAGTHRYVSYLYGWHNINGATCNGSNATDGECFIFDRPDIGPVTTAIVVEHTLCIGNGSFGIEVFALTNPAGTVPVLIRNNTDTGNMSDPSHTGTSNRGILVQGGSTGTYVNATLTANLTSSYSVTSGLILGRCIASSTRGCSRPIVPSTEIGCMVTGQATGISRILIRDIHAPKGEVRSAAALPTTTSCPGNTITTDPVFAGAAYRRRGADDYGSGADRLHGCRGGERDATLRDGRDTSNERRGAKRVLRLRHDHMHQQRQPDDHKHIDGSTADTGRTVLLGAGDRCFLRNFNGDYFEFHTHRYKRKQLRLYGIAGLRRE